MKRKIECDINEMAAFIVELLNQRVSESDRGGSPITKNELERILEEDYQFSAEELCEVLNILISEDKARVYLEVDSEGSLVVTELFLGLDGKARMA